MAQLVTLAHRVSGIHVRYAKIHDALFSVSLFKKKLKRKANGETAYASFAFELKELAAKLAEIDAMICKDVPMERNTSFTRKFATTLQQYTAALSASIEQLSEICDHRDRWGRGEQPYDPEQSRADRLHYDESMQQHRSLGVKLSHMVTHL